MLHYCNNSQLMQYLKTILKDAKKPKLQNTRSKYPPQKTNTTTKHKASTNILTTLMMYSFTKYCIRIKVISLKELFQEVLDICCSI